MTKRKRFDDVELLALGRAWERIVTDYDAASAKEALAVDGTPDAKRLSDQMMAACARKADLEDEILRTRAFTPEGARVKMRLALRVMGESIRTPTDPTHMAYAGKLAIAAAEAVEMIGLPDAERAAA